MLKLFAVGFLVGGASLVAGAEGADIALLTKGASLMAFSAFGWLFT